MQLGSNPATTPTRIIRDAEHRTVRIPWADGHESVYDWEYLRRSCRCANCHGEWGTPGYLASNPILMVDQTFLKHMQHVGRYAVQLIWGDGHDTGLFAFRDLRALCPCPECRASSHQQ
jgi:DUF971 family protein